MIHGFIKNALEFGIEAAEAYPEATDEKVNEWATWLSRHPNAGTFTEWWEEKHRGGIRSTIE